MPGSRFVWYELMTDDVPAAQAFYRRVVGWTAEPAPQAEPRYLIMSAPTGPVAGIMAMPDEVRAAGGRTGWLGYVGIADADAAASAVERAGGKVHRAPADIPGVGRFAVVADPQGAVFVVFSPAQAGDTATASGTGAGQGGWHELYASDWPAAFAFYSGLFGWTKAEAVDMGAMGLYQLFAADGVPIGGMMNKPDQVPVPVWQYYFNVPAIEAAVTAVREAGGEVLAGPHPVPGGSWILHCRDPRGAHFALVAPPA